MGTEWIDIDIDGNEVEVECEIDSCEGEEPCYTPGIHATAGSPGNYDVIKVTLPNGADITEYVDCEKLAKRILESYADCV